MMTDPEIVLLLAADIRCEQDIVTCRQHARHISESLGFELQSQTRIATAVSEIARNAYQYAGGGVANFRVETETAGDRRFDQRQQSLVITIRDEGGGIENLDLILAGQYRSSTGMGLGIVGARRLMDQVDIKSSPSGSAITMRKNLPPGAGRKTTRELEKLVVGARGPSESSVISEVKQQNQELIRVMDEVRLRQEELSQLNRELAETNAGVMALYDELDTLHRVGLLLASKIDQAAVIQALIEATTDLTGAEFGACYLRLKDDPGWIRYASAGPRQALLAGLPREQEADFFGADFGTEGVVHVPDLSLHPQPSSASKFAEVLLPQVTLRSCLTVALANAQKSVFGALVFCSSQPAIFSERSERIVSSIAAQAAVAIDKARLYESVKAASEAKDRFLAMISHELRTPLNPVLGIVSGLSQDSALPVHIREDIAVVLRNVQLEVRLIDDLLDFHRIIKGKVDFASEVVDMHGMIANVIEICKTEIDSRTHEVALSLAAEKFQVQGDPARLQQVLWNVLKNAIKFTDPGGAIMIETAVEGDATLRVSVRDTGRGIDPKLLKDIFNAFEQGHLDGITQFGGLGLGLAIAKAFVEKHNGTIVAESAGLSQGATFTLRLPLANVEPAAGSQGLLPAREGDSVRGKLLLIDDHSDTLWSLSRLLERHGYKVTSAKDCAEALARARESSFDIIVSDLGLPDGSGLELIGKMRRFSSAPAIALSGYGMESDVAQAMEAGFNLHLTKPVVLQSLLRAIESLSPISASQA